MRSSRRSQGYMHVMLITVIAVVSVALVAIMVWFNGQLGTVSPTNTNGNTNTSTNSSANANTVTTENTNQSVTTNTAVLCTAQEDCRATCEDTDCPPTTQLFWECTAGNCQCACLENGPEDTFDPSTPLFNGDVGTACTRSSECLIVSNELDYSQCFAGYCDTVNYAESQWVAVNGAAFTAFRDALNDGGACGIQPACPTVFNQSGYLAECIESVCRKVHE